MATLTLHGSMEAIIKAVLAAYTGVVTTRKIVVDGKEDIGEERGGRS